MGRVIAISGKKAQVRYFDGRTSNEVDLSFAPARRGAYVELFGSVALSVLSPAEARRREAAWQQVKQAGAVELAQLEVMTRGR